MVIHKHRSRHFLRFGLCELEKMGRLTSFPADLRELRLVLQKPISCLEIAELDGLRTRADDDQPVALPRPVIA